MKENMCERGQKEQVENKYTYAALSEFHSGTPAERPVFENWRRMLSCARFLAQWFAAAEERNENIGVLDEKKLKFGVDDGRVQYDGCDVADLSDGLVRGDFAGVWKKSPEKFTWSLTQFVPPEVLESVLKEDEPESEFDETRSEDGGERYAEDESKQPEESADEKITKEKEADRYQLAVLLFRLLFGCHPIRWPDEIPKGAKEWLKTLRTHGTFRFAEGCEYPKRFLYPYAADRWDIVPTWYRDACIFSFTEGLEQPQTRVSAGEWLGMINELCATYARVRDPETGKNKHCFFSDEKNKNLQDATMVLQTDSGRMFLPPGSKVYIGDFCGEPGCGARIGETGRLKKQGNAVGIRMSVPWEVYRYDYGQKVAPGEIRVLEGGMLLLVDHHLGIIR